MKPLDDIFNPTSFWEVGVWAGAVVGGHHSPSDAKRAVLKDCERVRRKRDLPGECKIYAVGHEIVWDKPVAESGD